MAGKGKKKPKIGELGKTDFGTAFDSPKFGGDGGRGRRSSGSGGGERRRGGRVARGITSAAIGLYGAYSDVSDAHRSMVSGALPGRAEDALSSLQNTAETTQRAERDRQRDDLQGGIRDKGIQDRGTSRRHRNR